MQKGKPEIHGQLSAIDQRQPLQTPRRFANQSVRRQGAGAGRGRAARAAASTFNAVEALGQLSLTPGSVVIRHASDGDWCEVTDCSTGKRGRVPASAIQEVKETTGAAPPTTAPEKKKGYTYSSLPSLTGGPKRKIYKQPKKR